VAPVFGPESEEEIMNGMTKGLALAAALTALQGCSWLGFGDKSDIVSGHNERPLIDQQAKVEKDADLKDAVIGFDTVYFDYDKATLRAEALPVLTHLAKWMEGHPDVRLRISGHADERGTREYNLALGDRRAATVRNYLASLGVPAQRLDTVSYGKERPAVAGSNEDAWAKNRRAVAELE
jgi:peptidoglycan-associated lipoprotein